MTTMIFMIKIRMLAKSAVNAIDTSISHPLLLFFCACGKGVVEKSTDVHNFASLDKSSRNELSTSTYI